MTLYVIRHADAVRVGGTVVRDADRPLSARGEEEATRMGCVLAHLDHDIGLILTSPLLRARRTGELLASAPGGHASTRTTENLSPGFRHKALLQELAAVSSLPAVVIVGHQPDLGQFISFLISDTAHAAVSLAPCAVARIDFESADLSAGAGLVWLLTPALAGSLHSTMKGEGP